MVLFPLFIGYLSWNVVAVAVVVLALLGGVVGNAVVGDILVHRGIDVVVAVVVNGVVLPMLS